LLDTSTNSSLLDWSVITFLFDSLRSEKSASSGRETAKSRCANRDEEFSEMSLTDER